MNPLLFVSSGPISTIIEAKPSHRCGWLPRSNNPPSPPRRSIVHHLASDSFYGLTGKTFLRSSLRFLADSTWIFMMCSAAICTDDGDFALFGINAEESVPDDNDRSSGSEMGPNLSSLMAATSFSGLLNESPPSVPTQTSSGAPSVDDVSFDGMFGRLASGIDVGIVLKDDLSDNATSLNDALFGRLSSDFDVSMARKDDTIRERVQTQSDDKSLSRNKMKRSTDEGMFVDVKDWLLEMMPKLNGNDVDTYAHGLCDIGFHPGCVTQCELRYEDLDFMKVLHQRYIFNEITGAEHPWEV